MKKGPGVFLVLFLCCLILKCIPGVKRIENYREIKRGIPDAVCIINADFMKVMPSEGENGSFWTREPSVKFNNYAESLIQDYVRHLSTRRFKINFRKVDFSNSEKNVVSNMFTRLKGYERIDEFFVGQSVLAVLDTIKSNNVLLIWQNGYHFTKDYIDKVESIEALHTITSIASVGMAVAVGGLGVISYGRYDKGSIETRVALIDKKEKRVLYYTSRNTRDNPLTDSTMIYHVSNLFAGF